MPFRARTAQNNPTVTGLSDSSCIAIIESTTGTGNYNRYINRTNYDFLPTVPSAIATTNNCLTICHDYILDHGRVLYLIVMQILFVIYSTDITIAVITVAVAVAVAKIYQSFYKLTIYNSRQTTKKFSILSCYCSCY